MIRADDSHPVPEGLYLRLDAGLEDRVRNDQDAELGRSIRVQVLGHLLHGVTFHRPPGRLLCASS